MNIIVHHIMQPIKAVDSNYQFHHDVVDTPDKYTGEHRIPTLCDELYCRAAYVRSSRTDRRKPGRSDVKHTLDDMHHSDVAENQGQDNHTGDTHIRPHDSIEAAAFARFCVGICARYERINR